MRSVLPWVCAVVACAAIACTSIAVASPAAADDCVDGYLARCQSPDAASPRITGPVGQVRTVQGVPCTGAHLGVCIALTQSRGGSFRP